MDNGSLEVKWGSIDSKLDNVSDAVFVPCSLIWQYRENKSITTSIVFFLDFVKLAASWINPRSPDKEVNVVTAGDLSW